MSHIEKTEVLNQRIKDSKNVKLFLNEHIKEINVSEFHQCLYHFIQIAGIKSTTLFRKADLAESYGYQLLNGKRQPSRNKVLQLSVGLGLSVDDANYLLRSAEKSELYVRNKRDAIVMFALDKGLNLMETNEILDEETGEILV